MACWAFLAGRESARLMVRAARQHFLHWRHRLVRGGRALRPSPAPNSACARWRSRWRANWDQEHHVGDLIIDSGVDTAWVRERRAQIFGKEALDNPIC